MSEAMRVIPREEIINITDFVDIDGILNWDVPKGKWKIIRFCYTLTGSKVNPPAWGGEGYEVDKLNADHVAFQFHESIGKLYDKVQDRYKDTFEGVLIDSYEAGYQTWTENILQKFEEEYGYNIIDFLPIFTGRYVETAKKSEKILSDYRRLLDIMLAENFYGTMQRLANEHGLKLYVEPQVGPVHSLYAMDFIDVPMNEFWIHSVPMARLKFTASVAATKNKNIVAAEAFAARPDDGKWQNTPWTLKKIGDAALTSGINQFCFHTFVHQPVDYAVPGFTMGRYGTMFSRHLTWWKASKEWITYLTRSQYLLQQGQRVSDVCFLFNDEVRYAFPIETVDLPFGFDYTVIYPKDLEHAKSINGELVLQSGLKFERIILPGNWIIEQSTAIKLLELVREGCQLICEPSSLEPLGIEYINTGEFCMGIGKIYVNKDINISLKETCVMPDIQVDIEEPENTIYFTHRETENEHIYFLSNQSDKSFNSKVTFKVSGLTPQLWDQSTGNVSDLPFKLKDNRVDTRISFDSFGSCFVVFDKNKPAEKSVMFKENNHVDTKSYSLIGPWQLSFSDHSQIDENIELNDLVSLNLFSDDRVKYYSGTIIYTKEFEVNTPKHNNVQYIIDLGEIYDIAEVKVNGNNAGILWKKPYKTEITKLVRNGTNKLEIAITNTWRNRIIGDERLMTDLKYNVDEDNIFQYGKIEELPVWLYKGFKPDSVERFTFSTWKHYDAESELPSSGLIGPVTIAQIIEKNK